MGGGKIGFLKILLGNFFFSGPPRPQGISWGNFKWLFFKIQFFYPNWGFWGYERQFFSALKTHRGANSFWAPFFRFIISTLQSKNWAAFEGLGIFPPQQKPGYKGGKPRGILIFGFLKGS